MKIGLFSYNYRSLSNYWKKLKNQADCWWGVPEEALYKTLKKNNIDNVVYFLEEHKKNILNNNKEEYKKTSSLLPIENNDNIKKKIIKEINPDIWITDSSNKINNLVSENTPMVQTFHSIPIKKHVFHKPVLDYNLILLPGQYHKDQFIKKFNLQKNDERFKIIGWPRIDELIKGNYDRNKIMLKYNLDPEKKTVMYAPTWGWGFGNTAMFARWFDRELKVFEDLCKNISDNNLNFITRLHCYTYASSNNKFIEIAKKYNVSWPTTLTSNYQEDPNEFLWITDILISDLSGIITEFMVLNRPIIYIDPAEEITPWEVFDMPKNFRAGYVVKKPEELFEAIKDAIQLPYRHLNERKNILDKIFYKLDGNASDRAAEAVLNFAKDNRI